MRPEDEVRAERRYEKLRQTNMQLARRLEESKVLKKDLVRVVFEAAREAAQSLDIAPVKAPPAQRKHDGQSEYALVALSDMQLGKRTPSYTTAVCERRVRLYADKIRELTDIQRSNRPIREARVYMLGDMVEGEMIFPGQAHRIDASLYRQVTVDGPRILIEFLRNLLTHFERVKVISVIGNHGRVGKRGDYHPETNSDLMLYRICQMAFETMREPRLTWEIPFQPGERSWYAVDTIGRHRYMLFHGDQMRGGGFAGIPMYGFLKAISAWASGVIPKGFDYALCATPDTEALTESGWKRHDEIRPGERIATLHPETGAFEWQESVVNAFEYSGDVAHFKGDTMDHIFTPDHRMWTRLPRGAWKYREVRAGKWSNWRVQSSATEWAGEWGVSGRLASADPGDVAEFVGWYLSEGSVDARQVRIAQLRTANPEKYERIVGLIERLGFRPSCSPIDVRICNTEFAAWVNERFGHGCDAKVMPAWVRGWPTSQLDRLLDAMVQGDGHVLSKKCWQYGTTSRDLADGVQEIALKLGWSVCQSWRQRENRKRFCDMTLTRASERMMPRREPTTMRYDGVVWCPTVKNGLWFARRNGKVVVTGNCGHWHSMWSMPINNRILWVNGSTESDNTWVQEELKARSDPGQWLLFAHPRIGVTSEHRVWLAK